MSFSRSKRQSTVKRTPSRTVFQNKTRNLGVKKHKIDTTANMIACDDQLLSEAWDYDAVTMPDGPASIILEYLDTDVIVNSNKYSFQQYSKFKLFKQNFNQFLILKATEAAVQIMLGNADNVIKAVAENPYILHCRIPEVRDPIRRNILLQAHARDMHAKGEVDASSDSDSEKEVVIYRDTTLLRVAGAEGYMNYQEPKEGEKNYGLVEQLRPYLTPEEFLSQWQEQFPEDWYSKTTSWLAPYYNAAEIFVNKMEVIDIPDHATFAMLRDEYEPTRSAIWELRIAFARAARREVSIGLRLSPEINPYLASDHFWGKFKQRFDLKVNFYLIIVCGLAHELAMGCDARIYANGLNNLMNPERSPFSLQQLDLNSYYSMGLGDSLFFNIYDGKHSDHLWDSRGMGSDVIKRFIMQKHQCCNNYGVSNMSALTRQF